MVRKAILSLIFKEKASEIILILDMITMDEQQMIIINLTKVYCF